MKTITLQDALKNELQAMTNQQKTKFRAELTKRLPVLVQEAAQAAKMAAELPQAERSDKTCEKVTS